MRHTVVLSDLHLWEAVDGDGLWMRYRQRRFFPDESISKLLDALTRDVADGDFELVLDGDIFDFDVPRPDGRDDTPHNEPDAARRIERILDDHPVFVTALARLVSRGHRVVFVSGNHDVQLAFAAVRERILARLEQDGLAGNTVVLFMGDNGEAHIRGKQFCYEEGLRVPLIVRWPRGLTPPARFRAGAVEPRLLEAIEIGRAHV